jgi:ApbE superfamily uncharacterized protein (UPF0280 family)
MMDESKVSLSINFLYTKKKVKHPHVSCAKHSSVGSSIASGMAAAITTRNSTSNWRDESQV